MCGSESFIVGRIVAQIWLQIGIVGMIPKRMNQIWYLLSCGAFLATLYLLIKPYRNQARANHPQSKPVFDKILTAHKVILEAREIREPGEEDLMMQLSPLFLEKLQAAELVGEQRGEQRGEVNGKNQGRVEEASALVIRLLTRKLGSISPPLLVQIEALSLERVELLGEDLLDFTSIDNLEQWLA